MRVDPRAEFARTATSDAEDDTDDFDDDDDGVKSDDDDEGFNDAEDASEAELHLCGDDSPLRPPANPLTSDLQAATYGGGQWCLF